MEKMKVCIVDDHALFRRGVAEIIGQADGYQLIGEYVSGLDFLENFPQLLLDVLLLDVQMPHLSGLEVLKEIRKTNQQLKIVLLTACEDEDVIIDAIRYGANGFLPKDTLPDVILFNLAQVIQGQTVLHEQGINVLARQIRIHQGSKPEQLATQNTAQHVLLSEITDRERQTLHLIAKGLNNKLIARELGISDGTVKVYVKNLLRKLNVHSRLELSVWVHQNIKLTHFDCHA
ncbi:response regulator [Acinetobacter terrae]|uniref:response regulator n=1 Tax=Acinetobacter terrae TaxID=2731247 RepID=UPI0007D83DB0|nr:response regulator [Acinetobacter terrae]OAL83114.1 two-component system response regulator [Acinetobacter terrae]